MLQWPQSTTIRVPFQAYLASDHLSAATGKTIAITISKNGGAFGNPSAGATNAVEISVGSYYVDLSTTDTGTLGPVIVRGAVATVDDVFVHFYVVAATAEIAAIKAKTDNLPSDPADASDVAGAFSTVNGTLATIAGYLDTEIAAIKAKTDNLPGSPAAVGSAMTLTSGERNSIATAHLDLTDGVETGVTVRQKDRTVLAACAGKADGLGSSTAHYRDQADGKNRITATVDADGNRSAITLDTS